MKVEKNPGKGSEIVPEIVSLQSGRRAITVAQAAVMPDCVPFA